MSKKETVREYIDAMKDKAWFTVGSLAKQLGVEGKDVHNTMAEYLADGRMQKEKEPGSKHIIYRKVGNVVAAVALKTKQDSANAYQARRDTPPPATPRRKVRSPLVRAIDDEIKALENKIKDLRRVRRDYD